MPIPTVSNNSAPRFAALRCIRRFAPPQAAQSALVPGNHVPGKSTAFARKSLPCLLLLMLGCILPIALLSHSATAAELKWEALPDRERLTINLGMHEGVLGKAGRITATSIVIPSTLIPQDELVREAPPEAKLFMSTVTAGRSLVVRTKTPEFGFFVQKTSHSEIILDLYPNPLGARWKPSRVAPTTEAPPDKEVQPSTPPDAATIALHLEPGGVGPLSRQAREEVTSGQNQTTDTTKTPGVSSQGQSALPHIPDQNHTSQSAGQAPAVEGERSKPTVVSLSGTPIYAAEMTAMAQPPIEQPLPAKPDSPRNIDSAALKGNTASSLNKSAGQAAAPAGTPEPLTGNAALPVGEAATATRNIVPPSGNAGRPAGAAASSPSEKLAFRASVNTSPLRVEPPMTALPNAYKLSGASSFERDTRAHSRLYSKAQAAPSAVPLTVNALPELSVPAKREDSGVSNAPAPGQTNNRRGDKRDGDAGIAARSQTPETPPVIDNASPKQPKPDAAPSPDMVPGQDMPQPELAMPQPEPGTAVRSGPATYRGPINTEGFEKAEQAARAGNRGERLEQASADSRTPAEAQKRPGAASSVETPASAGGTVSGQISRQITGDTVSQTPSEASGQERQSSSLPEQGQQAGTPSAQDSGKAPQSSTAGQTADVTVSPAPTNEKAGPTADATGVNASPNNNETPPGSSQSPANSGQPPASAEPGSDQVPEPTIEELLAAMREAAEAGDKQATLTNADALLARTGLEPGQREEVLHIRADALFSMHKENFDGHYTLVSDALTAAINFNPKSPRNAIALLHLGYMNLKLGNFPEANAHFNMMRRNFPNDEHVPLTYYYWAEHYFAENDLQKAADEYQLILQKYPNSRYAREAALGLARSYYGLEYYEQAFTIVDYIERRWEHFYLEHPPFLNMMGDVAYRLDKKDDALRHYWLYLNLLPNGPEVDIILTRIGDLYSAMRENSAANQMYKECISRFPDTDGGLVALMRLAERSVNDDPSIAGMFSLFDGPFSNEPLRVYESIINDHPESGLVPLAKIKLAMWHLWKRDFKQTFDSVTDFLQRYPNHELAPRAREIALQAFSVLASSGVADGDYRRMHEVWEQYPIVHDQSEALAPESRIALGVSYWKDGKPNEALDTIAPFFLGRKVPEYSEMALSLALSMYLEFDQWQAILDVAGKVDLWEMKTETRRQLDYALALAHENLGQEDQAEPIWQKLYDGDQLPPAQKAYASYFLARHAEKTRDLERAYNLGREALSKLLEQADRSNNPADINKVKSQLASLIDIAETAGRLREALTFANQYLEYLQADTPERTVIRYRMARIHKKQGDLDSWKTILTDIAIKQPNTVYGQVAASELKAAAITEDAARYSPTGKL